MTANNNDSITLDAIGKRSLTNEPNNNGGDKIITRSKRTRKETVTNRKLVTGNRTRKKSCSIDGETSSRKSSTDVKPKKSNTCEVCQKVFQGQNDLKKHFRIHTDERPYPCTYCDKSFRQSGCLKNHIASQHGTNILYTCFYCNKKFPIKERLRLHMRLHSGEKPYKCDMCPKQFARGGQLVHHRTTHKGIRKKFKCMTCPASFSCSVNLKLHIKSHNGIRDYVCNICGKDFIRPDALKKHEICFHKNVKAFQCKICNKTFKGRLPQHMRTHENIKPFGCAECRATFSRRSQLNVHIRVHSGERPYRCPVCWQAFAHSSVLKLHIRKHTGEKPFRCVLCVENLTAFSQLPHLKTHMRAIHGIDRYYLCKKCNNFFKTKLELQQHQMDCEETAVDSVDQKEIIPTDDRLGIEPPFEVTKMRVNIAVLLKKISTEERLKALGFEKRLIDNVLVGALKASGQKYNEDKSLSEADRLKENVQYLLEWLINPSVMSKFREENRSVEDLLDKLANADDFKSTED